jgi:uncharacterized cofD-like protein
VSLLPEVPPACPEAVAAVLSADWVVLGPGSWFTSVLPHLLVPELAAAICATTAQRLLVLNLDQQPGETEGFAPESYLEVLTGHAPDLALDVVLADPSTVTNRDALQDAADRLGAEVVLAPLAHADHPDQHDPDLLATALDRLFIRDRQPSDRI